MSEYENLAAAMKAGMRHLASGVAVVATRVGEERSAMTVTSITSVSDTPPSVLVCLHRESTTYQSLAHTDYFSANILRRDQAEISNRCAFAPTDEERFTLGDWRDDPTTGTPYLADDLASFICRVKKKVDYGTHCIIVGDIEAVTVAEDHGEPLIYCRGDYAHLHAQYESGT